MQLSNIFTKKKKDDEEPILPCTVDVTMKMSREEKEAFVEELKKIKDPEDRERQRVALAFAKALQQEDHKGWKDTASNVWGLFVICLMCWSIVNVVTYAFKSSKVEIFYSPRSGHLKFPPEAAKVADPFLEKHATWMSKEKYEGFNIALDMIAELEKSGLMLRYWNMHPPKDVKGYYYINGEKMDKSIEKLYGEVDIYGNCNEDYLGVEEHYEEVLPQVDSKDYIDGQEEYNLYGEKIITKNVEEYQMEEAKDVDQEEYDGDEEYYENKWQPQDNPINEQEVVQDTLE